MTNHKITVAIVQEFDYGATRECKAVLRDCDQYDEPPGDIGAAVGNAVRQILAAQNTGCDVNFWEAFFHEMLNADDGQWIWRLFKHVESWWGQTDNEVTFDQHMQKFIKPMADITPVEKT